jgi:hypothetical protein
MFGWRKGEPRIRATPHGCAVAAVAARHDPRLVPGWFADATAAGSNWHNIGRDFANVQVQGDVRSSAAALGASQAVVAVGRHPVRVHLHPSPASSAGHFRSHRPRGRGVHRPQRIGREPHTVNRNLRYCTKGNSSPSVQLRSYLSALIFEFTLAVGTFLNRPHHRDRELHTRARFVSIFDLAVCANSRPEHLDSCASASGLICGNGDRNIKVHIVNICAHGPSQFNCLSTCRKSSSAGTYPSPSCAGLGLSVLDSLRNLGERVGDKLLQVHLNHRAAVQVLPAPSHTIFAASNSRPGACKSMNVQQAIPTPAESRET